MASKTEITSLFKMHGLSLRSDGSQYLCRLLEPINSEEHEDLLDKVITAVQQLPLSSAIINKQDIQKAAKDVLSSVSIAPSNLLHVVAPSATPRLNYSVERCKFVLAPLARALHGTPTDKANVFRNRYSTVYHRTRQHQLFRPPPAGTPSHLAKQFGLTKIEFLLGGGGGTDGVVVLGMLTQEGQGKLGLEDDTGAIKLDISEAKFHTGLFPHNCLVLAEGRYEDSVMHCQAVGLPPAERADSTRSVLGNLNYFGGPGPGCAKYNAKMQGAQGNKDAIVVIVSDVWLDNVRVMAKLEELFRGFSCVPPSAFILCGNFLSASHAFQQVAGLRQLMSTLGDVISQYPNLLEKSRFIFVPGPNDPGACSVYPRPPLPDHLVSELRAKVPCAEFVANPCRLLYCTQEIVVFREDIMTKMCRNSVYFPSSADDIPAHFAKTLVSQAHLSPLPLHVVPTYWAQDHCLSLHPTPDLIVVADRADPFTTTNTGAIVTNPGSFLKTNFSFKVYYPGLGEVEDSHIRDEEEEQGA